MDQIKESLAQGATILIDGATGTELELRGVPMVEKGWSAMAALTHPDIVRQIHEDYIRLGAEVIIANTFSTAQQVLDPIGLGDKFEALNTSAIELAKEARDRQNAPQVKIAASLTTARLGSEYPPANIFRQQLTKQAQLFAELEVDLMILEMMNGIWSTQLALEAAASTDLPIWLGLSCKVDETGTVGMWNRDHTLTEFLDGVSLAKVDVLLVMHTLTEDVDACLEVIQSYWTGPLGVYAHSGEFTPPNWNFIDMISPDDYAANAQRWLDRGVQVVGGCCGIGPAHIERLREVVG